MAMSKEEFRTRITSDVAFRNELKKDPVKVLRSIGWDVDADTPYEVIDLDSTKRYLVLPPLRSTELTEDDLASVSGGTGRPVCTY